MQYLQETTKVVDYIKKVHLIEEEARSLRCNNMKLKLRNEELMMKYNPGKLPLPPFFQLHTHTHLEYSFQSQWFQVFIRFEKQKFKY